MLQYELKIFTETADDIRPFVEILKQMENCYGLIFTDSTLIFSEQQRPLVTSLLATLPYTYTISVVGS